MSSIKEDIDNNPKNNEKKDFNISNFSYIKINPKNSPISSVMSNFLENITKKKQIMQKEFDMYNRTILNLQRKRSKIMSKNVFLFSSSTSKFPLISSRYKDIFLSQKQTKSKDFNSSVNKQKNNSFQNFDIKEIKKSRSEYKMDFTNKKNKNDFFKTSIGRNYKLINYNNDLNKKNEDKSNYSQIENPNLFIKDIQDIISEKDKMDGNIMYRLNKISNKNLKNLVFSDEENIKEKSLSPSTSIHKDNNKVSFFNVSKSGTRKKKFKIEVIRGWEFKNGLNVNNFNEKAFIEDKEYQKNLISNQIDIIIDNTNYFKLNHINILAHYIKHDDLNLKFLIKLNILIEETSTLFIEISHLIIKDFESFLLVKHKLPTCSPPEMIDGVEVDDEKFEFGTDIKLLNECTKFLTSSYEIYLVLNKQTNYIIPMKKFVKIRHFLNRARFNINNLVSISKKYIEEIRYEKGIINQFNEQKDLIEKNLKLKNKQYSNCNRTSDGLESLQEKKTNFQNVGVDKMRRLNNLLNPLGVDKNSGGIINKKRYIGKHIDVDAKMFNKIVEYMEPQIKERFEAFSVTQKKIVNKNTRKVYKFDF
jgi:hypothetical protein